MIGKPQDDQDLIEKLRAKLGTPKKVDERAELERLFGKTVPTAEDALREKLVKHQPVLVKGDLIEVFVEKIAFGGEGIARHKNVTIFVPDAIPGDTVRVRIDSAYSDYFKSQIVETIARSSDRISPVCPLFTQCGGCHLLNLSYPAQLRAKRQMIEDALKPMIQDTSIVRPVIPSPDAFKYRLRAKLQIDSETASHCRIGFFAQKSHDLVEIQECPLMTPLLNRTLHCLAEAVPAPHTAPLPREIHLHSNLQGDQISIHLVSDEPVFLTAIFANLKNLNIPVTGISNQASHNRFDSIGKPLVCHSIGGVSLEAPSTSFFQSNAHLLKTLMDQTLMLASPNLKDHILDLYCGVGFFSISLGRFAQSVTGYDLDAVSIQSARQNATTAGIENARFSATPDSIPFHPLDQTSRPSLLIADPPRNGISATWMKQIRDLKCPKLLYISCNPSTFSRDLGQLLDEGYRLRVVQPIDLFPQTFHIEVLAFLTHPLTHIQAASSVMPDLR